MKNKTTSSTSSQRAQPVGATTDLMQSPEVVCEKGTL